MTANATKAPTHFRCGDERTPENTTTKGECRRCKNARQVAFYKASSVKLRRPKRTPKAVRWTVAPDFPAVLAVCRPRYLAAIGQDGTR